MKLQTTSGRAPKAAARRVVLILSLSHFVKKKWRRKVAQGADSGGKALVIL
jgi:hypothetical protein